MKTGALDRSVALIRSKELRGTGFFLSPRLLVTAAHVVENAPVGAPVAVDFLGRPYRASVLAKQSDVVGKMQRNPFPDIALLQFESDIADCTPLRLTRTLPVPGANVYSRGFPAKGEAGEDALATFEGTKSVTLDAQRIRGKLGSSQFRPGMSGAPAVLTNGFVAGVITLTRDERTDLGGFFTPTAELERAFQAHVSRFVDADGIFDERVTDRLGISGLPKRSAVDVEQFIGAYLGSPEQPVPFGARADELAQLDAWLNDEQRSFGLLEARAGLGKSALLVAWLARLAAREATAHIVYHPISARFKTNSRTAVFESLAGQLQALHGETSSSELDAETYRGAFRQLCLRAPSDGRRVLIVLDGLDEAAGWEADAALFSPAAPGRLKVLVAARSIADGWLRRLAWKPSSTQRFSLGLLGQRDVREVLVQTGGPFAALAHDDAAVTRLSYLSDNGDPLLLRYFLDQLADVDHSNGTIEGRDLENLHPGFAGIFDDWLRDQQTLWGKRRPLREPAVNGLLAMCALAKGPLTREDVAAVDLPLLSNAETIIDAASDLRRFLVGDGVRFGYAFSHPRFAQYFAERLSRPERERWVRHFRDTGQRIASLVAAGDLPPQHVPPYFIRWHVAQLVESGADLDAFRPILTHRRFIASEAVEGSPSAYLTDLRDVLERARSAGAAGLGAFVRTILIRAGVLTSYLNISLELFTLALEHRVIGPTLGLVLARRQRSAADRTRYLLAVADVAVASGERRSIIAEALQTAREVEENEMGLEPRAAALLAVAKRLDPASSRALVLGECLAAKGKTTGMLASPTFAEIAEACGSPIPPELVRAAIDEARAVGANTPWASAHALARLSGVVEEPQRTALLAEAQHWSARLSSPHLQASTLSRISARLPSNESAAVVDRAIELARAESTTNFKADGLIAVLAVVEGAERAPLIDEACLAARSITDAYGRAIALTQIVPFLDDTRRADVQSEALACARLVTVARASTFKRGSDRADALCRVAATLGAADAVPIVRDALAIARVIGDVAAQRGVLVALAAQLPPGERAAAVDSELMTFSGMRTDESPKQIVEFVGIDVSGHARQQMLASMLDAVRRMRGFPSYQRAAALARIGERLVPPEDAALLPALFEAIREIEVIDDREAPALALARALPNGAPPELLTELLTIVQHVRRKIIAESVTDNDRNDHLLGLSAMMYLLEARIAGGTTDGAAALERALAHARCMNPAAMARSLGDIAAHVDDVHARRLVAEALTHIERIGDGNGWDLAETVSSVAAHLTGRELAPLLRYARELKLFPPVLPLLRRLADNWLAVCDACGVGPLNELHARIEEAAPFGREHLLETIRSLAPALATVGGSDAIEETMQAVRDAAAGWP